jgi:uncharacterized protein YcaQ
VTRALERDRTLFEHRAMIRPMADLALYRPSMAAWEGARDQQDLPADEAVRRRDERRLVSLGVARSRMVGEAGEPAEVEGTRGAWRVDPAALGQPFAGRTALLSPFDRLVHDRVRAVALFDFEYVLEMYLPKAKRRWGYFALPVLHGDRLVGKVDATADRRAGVLRVSAIHEDVPFDRATTAAVRAELAALADWLGLGLGAT